LVDTIGWANAVSSSPTYNGRMSRQINGVGFAGATAARPLGAVTGVRPGTPASTVTATTTTWTCQAFAGLADVMVAAVSGAYPFAFDAVATGAVTAADATNPRIDIVWVKIVDPEDGTTTPTATRGYTAGVASATPAAPAPPAGAFTIAQIPVPKSGGGSPTVIWVAPYTAAAGGFVPFLTLAALNLWTTAADGTHANVFADGTNNGDYVSSSGAWKSAAGVLPFVSLGMTAAQNGGSGGAFVSVTWDLERSDVPDWHSTVTNPSRITVQKAGRYRATAHVTATTTSVGNYCGALFAVNGTALAYTKLTTPATAANFPTAVTTADLILAVGDYVEVQTQVLGTTALTVAESMFQLQYVSAA
jgi:hypothetical protein